MVCWLYLWRFPLSLFFFSSLFSYYYFIIEMSTGYPLFMGSSVVEQLVRIFKFALFPFIFFPLFPFFSLSFSSLFFFPLLSFFSIFLNPFPLFLSFLPCRCLGTPTEEVFPGLTHLPDYSILVFFFFFFFFFLFFSFPLFS